MKSHNIIAATGFITAKPGKLNIAATNSPYPYHATNSSTFPDTTTLRLVDYLRADSLRTTAD